MLDVPAIRGVLLAVLTTVLLVLVLLVIRMLFSKIRTRAEAALAGSEWAFQVMQLEIVSAGGLRRLAVWITNFFHTLSALLVLFVYTPLFLKFFPWTEPLARPFIDYFSDSFAVVWNAIVDYSPSLLHILVIFLFTWLILKVLRALFLAMQGGLVTLPGFYPEWAEPTYKIIRFLVFVLTLAMIFPLLPGADSPAFRGISLIVGAMVTLGSTSAMGNFTAGVLLIYTRSFKVGDFVRIGDSHGQVTERTLLVTRLASMKSENITIPNSRVLGSDVINYSAMPGKDGILVHLSVGLGYDLDWREAHRLMKNAALETTHIAKNPVPFVLQHSLDDFSVTYEINAYTQRSDILPGIRSELLANILDAFNTAEVEILSPRYTAVREGEEKAIPERSG